MRERGESVHLLIERLCNLEKQKSKHAENAFTACASKLPRTTSSRRTELEQRKKKEPCEICKERGHWRNDRFKEAVDGLLMRTPSTALHWQ